jgi:hypothetical protein
MHGRVAEVFNDGDEIESDFVEGQRVLFVRAKSHGRIFSAKKGHGVEEDAEGKEQAGNETKSIDSESEEFKENGPDPGNQRVGDNLEKSEHDSGKSQGSGDCSRTANRSPSVTTHRAAS